MAARGPGLGRRTSQLLRLAAGSARPRTASSHALRAQGIWAVRIRRRAALPRRRRHLDWGELSRNWIYEIFITVASPPGSARPAVLPACPDRPVRLARRPVWSGPGRRHTAGPLRPSGAGLAQAGCAGRRGRPPHRARPVAAGGHAALSAHSALHLQVHYGPHLRSPRTAPDPANAMRRDVPPAQRHGTMVAVRPVQF